VKLGALRKGESRVVTVKLQSTRTATGARTNPALATSSNASTVKSKAVTRIRAYRGSVLPAVTG